MGSLLLSKNSNSAWLFSLALLIFSLNHHYILSVNAKNNVHIVYMGEKKHEDLKTITDSHHEMLATVLGSKESAAGSMVYTYKGFSGFAAKLTKSQAQMVAELPGVVHVIPNRLYKPKTTRSWDYLGLSFQFPNNLLSKTNMGDGVIIGILDSGIWPESKSFNDEGLGPIPSRWKGVCESGDLFNSTSCNRKLIGARWYIQGMLAELGMPFNKTSTGEYLSPRDGFGHGTHVSAIAAGSFVKNTSYKGIALGTARGGAPRARLAMYKVCWNVGGALCASADILKAFDEAIHDGVDVLSLSLGPEITRFSDVDGRDVITIGSFHAVAKGIPVVCAGGNAGPSAQTVENTAPWIITVAASTIDRAFPTTITLGNNQSIVGQGMYGGKEIGFTGLYFPESPDEEYSTFDSVCEYLSLDNTTVIGNVVLCFASFSSSGVAMIASSLVEAAGGVGVIIVKNPSNSIGPCGDFPCIQVDIEFGTKILNYIRSSRSPLVKLSPTKTIIGKPVSTRAAYFSSRGPNPIAPAVLKPDIAAPGVNILAAFFDINDPLVDNGFRFLSGTSMATPHVSGTVAMLKSLHPDWSPAAIRSALVTTAWTTDPHGGPIFVEGRPQKLADPFDIGGGILNPSKAAYPGLIYNMDTTDYILYLCSMHYNNSAISHLTQHRTVCPTKPPSILDVNLPSITIPALRNSTILTRNVTNVGAVDSMYKAQIDPPLGITVAVKPDVLIFNSTTKTLSFKVTISTTHQLNTGYLFGSLTWVDGKYAVRSPISVRTRIIKSYAGDG